MNPALISTLLLLLQSTSATFGPGDQTLAKARGHLSRSRPDLALEVVEKELGSRPEARPDDETRVSLREMQARCLFELRDYPKCERVLRELCDQSKTAAGVKSERLGRLAEVLARQGRTDDAMTAIASALKLRDGPALRRRALAICLRGHAYDDALPHIASLLKSNPTDAFALFVRGIVRSRQGNLEAALPDLGHGIGTRETRDTALFERAVALGKLGRHEDALADLWELLVVNPYDDKACYQALRNLLRAGGTERLQLAAGLTRYLESLKEARGGSSRPEHLEAAGRPGEAAVLRGERFERLGRYAAARREYRSARLLPPRSAYTVLAEARFFIRVGLVREAEEIIGQQQKAGRLPDGPPGTPTIATAVAMLQATDAAAGDRPTAVAVALTRLRGSRGDDIVQALDRFLQAAVAAGSVTDADQAARLLLAYRRSSTAALRYMVNRTGTSDLVVQRAHFLARLSRLRGQENAAEALERLRQRFVKGK